MPEWLKGADCKSASVSLRWFESISTHHFLVQRVREPKGSLFVNVDKAEVGGKIAPVVLIGNAHLDPVWLRDRAEGMAETVATVHAVVRLMHERPELTFIRGERLVKTTPRLPSSSSLQSLASIPRSNSSGWDASFTNNHP